MIDKALIIVIIDSLQGIEDINDVSCYNFDLEISTGNRVKGVVKVEFEEVE